MTKDKQIEEMALTDVDILANDLNQHCADLAENYCGGVTCLSCLAHALTAKGYRKASEVAKEIFEAFRAEMRSEIARNEELFAEDEDDFYEGRNDAYRTAINFLAELKKKYTEDGE